MQKLIDPPPQEGPQLVRNTDIEQKKAIGRFWQVCTMVAHFICVLLTSFVAYVAKPGSSLFSWHPTLMTIAFAFLMMEGILLFSPQSSILQRYSRRVKANTHWIIMLLGLVCMLLGAAAIIRNKDINGAEHFTTWHGTIGIITVLYALCQALGGSFQMLSFLRNLLPKSMTLGKLKAYHATSGLTLYLLASVTLFLGMMSSWFTKNVTGTSWYACAFCPMVLLFITSNQVTNAYLPKPK